MDGILYATVSRNFSQAAESWFDFKYNAKPFYDQPPLAIWLQSVLFKIFGDSIYVERSYSFICGLLAVILLVLIWYKINLPEDLKQLSWIPIFFFCSVPLIFWSYSNNMLENTLSVFVMLSIYFQLHCIEKDHLLRFIFLSSFCIFLAFLSKGLVGLFPLVFLVFHWFCLRSTEFRKVLTRSFLLLIMTGICIFIFFFIVSGSLEYFKLQFNSQVLSSLSGEVNLSLRPFMVPRRLFKELLPAIIFSLILWLFAYYNGYYSWQTHKQVFSLAFLFLLVGLSASLPIMVSYKQRGYYLVPSFHFYVLSISIFMAPVIFSILNNVRVSHTFSKIAKTFIVLFGIISLILSFSAIGKIGRNKDKIADVIVLGNLIGKGRNIAVAENLSEDWYLLGYFQRLFDIAIIRHDDKEKPKYFLANLATSNIPDLYKKENLPLRMFVLYRRSDD